MKQATARFRRPANGGVRLGRARSAARLLMFVLLLAALVLLTLAVFYYTRNTAQAMEAELCQKMLVSAGQTRNNIDYRFEQVKESASALIGTLYPYLNSDADTAVQLEEYAKIRRALSEQLDKHMITRLRLYVPDEKIYSGQKTTLYSLDPLSSLGENGSVYQKGGVFWHGTHLVSLGISEPTAVVSCAVALKSQADYDKLCGVLFADVSVSQFHEIFAAGSTNHDEMFLADAQGRILAHTDDAHLGETALPPSLMEQVCSLGSGYLLEPDVILAFSRLETTEWYAATIGIRETRHVDGLYRLTVDDVRACRVPDDSIAVMATNMDTHNKNDPGGTYYTLENGPFFGVPYRCLIPRGISNLLVAGRSISADAMAGSAIRMIPCCLVFGQSAGTAAAMAASGACDPSRVDAQALRSLLLQQGAYLGQ